MTLLELLIAAKYLPYYTSLINDDNTPGFLLDMPCIYSALIITYKHLCTASLDSSSDCTPYCNDMDNTKLFIFLANISLSPLYSTTTSSTCCTRLSVGNLGPVYDGVYSLKRWEQDVDSHCKVESSCF